MYSCSVGHGGPSELHYTGSRLGEICSCFKPPALVVAECISFALVEVMQVIYLLVTLPYGLQKTQQNHSRSFAHPSTSPSVPAWLFRTKM